MNRLLVLPRLPSAGCRVLPAGLEAEPGRRDL